MWEANSTRTHATETQPGDQGGSQCSTANKPLDPFKFSQQRRGTEKTEGPAKFNKPDTRAGVGGEVDAGSKSAGEFRQSGSLFAWEDSARLPGRAAHHQSGVAHLRSLPEYKQYSSTLTPSPL